ncbi:hypothetical protein ABLE92_05605 [Gordonia sp. VNQ95]|uniref:hypothetical protein n=1 Tax=Gordonia sp. VNQ95 TaxID=3156619 RepID=UPI0032B3582F
MSPVYFGEPLPGWRLARARLASPVATWGQGEWGLFQVNDPAFRWSTTPTASPLWGMSDAEQKRWWAAHDTDDDPDVRRVMWFDDERCADFLDAFGTCSPDLGFDLVSGALQRGYRLDDGSFRMWFFDYLGEYLRTAEPLVEPYDERPELIRNLPFDPTIGRDPLPGEPLY